MGTGRLLRLRRGDPTVVEDYRAHGRVHGGSRDQMLTQALAAWKHASDHGESVVVLGVDHHTVDALAAEARRQLVAAGQVEPGGVITSAGQVIGVGDQIVTCHNQRQLLTTTGHWVRNGDRWTVTFTSEDGSVVVDSSEGHGRTVLDPGYVDEHVRLAYALTVHKAQGITVDCSILVADDQLTAEHAVRRACRSGELLQLDRAQKDRLLGLGPRQAKPIARVRLDRP